MDQSLFLGGFFWLLLGFFCLVTAGQLLVLWPGLASLPSATELLASLPLSVGLKNTDGLVWPLCLALEMIKNNLDLRSHLYEFFIAHARDIAPITQNMSANMDQCFSCFLDITANKLSPLAVAACFVNPHLSVEALI